VQLWVNRPKALKFAPPRYQAITRDDLALLTNSDGGVLLRLIAGIYRGVHRTGRHAYADHLRHATLAPGAQLSVPWNPAFSAMPYVLTGQGFVGPEERSVDHQLVQFGPGDNLVMRAADRIEGGWDALDVLLLGGCPSGILRP
jgi:redox-sensitive bicupin YhaK (pirin superfamily)